MKKIVKYVVLDILRNKIVLAYMLFLAIVSFSVFSLEDEVRKGLLTLMNLVLFIVPLVSVIFATIYMYNSSEFIELLLSQPVKRKTIWTSLFFGLSGSLVLAFLLGAGLPILIYDQSIAGLFIVLMGILLTIIFVAIGLVAVVKTRDKAKGIGFAILLWLYFALLFDGLVLFILFQFADYPIEKAMIAVSMLNPIDLGRILVLLQMDVSAMMGYTGAIFKDFFGTNAGLLASVTVLLLWIAAPLIYSLRKFDKKDL